MWKHLFPILALFFRFHTCFKTDTVSNGDKDDTYTYSLLMPNVHPNRPELYLCTPVKVEPNNKSYFIVGFEPNATMDTAHHMLLYGCSEPGNKKMIWDCGEMSNDEEGIETASPCSSGSQILYAWARDAPKLDLPSGVGFKIGAGTDIQYLVLQVHYGHVEKFKDGSTDNSGVFLHYTENKLNKLAGVLLLGTSGYILPQSTEKMETACQIEENKTIFPFAYRTHTHSLGKVVSGYKITQNGADDEWVLLGKRDPQTPQMFYPVENREPIKQGDFIAARCTMESHRTRITEIGATNNDEMCNFYLMYFVENDTPLDLKYCFTKGPPIYHWNNTLNHIPDADASSLRRDRD